MQEQQQAQAHEQFSRLQELAQEKQLAQQELAAQITSLQKQQVRLQADLSNRQGLNSGLQKQKTTLLKQGQLHHQQQIMQLQAKVSVIVNQKESLTLSLVRLQDQQQEWQVHKADVLARDKQQGHAPEEDYKVNYKN